MVPVLGQLPEFTLLNQEGLPFGSGQLLGKVWIANFMHTSCGDKCRQLDRSLSLLADRLSRTTYCDDVALVSFSMDPCHDTPPILQAFAQRSDLAGKRIYLTASVDLMRKISSGGFMLPVAADTQAGPIIETDLLVLLDRSGQIRGFYEGSAEESLKSLEENLQRVISEPFTNPTNVSTPAWSVCHDPASDEHLAQSMGSHGILSPNSPTKHGTFVFQPPLRPGEHAQLEIDVSSQSPSASETGTTTSISPPNQYPTSCE
jgi:protein SCO1/2